MTDQEFYDLSIANYRKLADKLVADGYERRDWTHSQIPSTFHKMIDGVERVLYLVTDFGDPMWYVARLDPRTRACK